MLGVYVLQHNDALQWLIVILAMGCFFWLWPKVAVVSVVVFVPLFVLGYVIDRSGLGTTIFLCASGAAGALHMWASSRKYGQL